MNKCRKYLSRCKIFNVFLLFIILILLAYGYTFFMTTKSNSVIPVQHKNISSILRKFIHFNETITEAENNIFKTLMKTFSEVVPWNVTYFLYSGTLLGSYRHHGMIPWDDDLDLLVRNENKQLLKECLSSLPDYELIMDGDQSWKFFHKSSIRTKRPWKWPFVDLFFYLENATHIWDSHRSWRYNKYLKTDIFPLARRPFMEMLLPAPRNTKYVLETLFNLDICESKFYDHKHERFMESSTVVQLPCNDLAFKFPFVRREYFTNRTVETVFDQNSNKNISTYTILNKQ